MKKEKEIWKNKTAEEKSRKDWRVSKESGAKRSALLLIPLECDENPREYI